MMKNVDYTDVDGRRAVRRRIIEVCDSEHVQRNSSETLKSHRQDERSQVLATVILLGINTSTTNMHFTND